MPAVSRLRLSRVDIQNYKSFDQLSIELPAPSTADQLDTFVLGSKNGVGKSSLLECCALSVLGAVYPRLLTFGGRSRDESNLYELLIRSGASKARIGAEIAIDGTSNEFKLDLYVNKGFRPSEQSTLRELGDPRWIHESAFEEEEVLNSLLGMNSEPLVLPPVLFFHSYRKVQEGSFALDSMISRRRYARPRRFGGSGSLSIFKAMLVQAMMARSGLFEGVKTEGDSESILDTLNGLLREFAGGTVEKLRPGQDGTLELRVTPTGRGKSFSFDGLSSGQKEIIATLFLIWYTTRERPSVVFIDEPELHLNAEWQRIFVHQLTRFAPENQYILATHSEEIFGSVTRDRRLMLQPD